MITQCQICEGHYSLMLRNHCPYCGALPVLPSPERATVHLQSSASYPREIVKAVRTNFMFNFVIRGKSVMNVYLVKNIAQELDGIFSTKESAQKRANYLMSIFPREKWFVKTEEVQD